MSFAAPAAPAAATSKPVTAFDALYVYAEGLGCTAIGIAALVAPDVAWKGLPFFVLPGTVVSTEYLTRM